MTFNEILQEVANSITSSSANSDWKLKTLAEANQSMEVVLDNLPNFKMTFLNALAIQEVTTDVLPLELSKEYEEPLDILHFNHFIRLTPDIVPCSGITITEMITKFKKWLDEKWIPIFGINLKSTVQIKAISDEAGNKFMAQLSFYTKYN